MHRSRTRAPTLLLALLPLAVLLGPTGCGCGSDDLVRVAGGGDLSPCPPIDIVFLMDTSGSMEDEAAALCGAIGQVEADLAARGARVANVTVLGLTQAAGDTDDPAAFACLPNHVAAVYGTAVPGSPPPAVSVLADDEDWGPATAIVAAFHPWVPDALRLVVPISDEGPFDGDPCDDPGDDRDSLEVAIQIANANNVIVSPIAATGSDACTVNLGVALAQGTGGTAFLSIDPAREIAIFVTQLIENACRGTDVETCRGEQLRVFDDSDALDDQFDVFVDDELLFRTPIGGGAGIPCINSIPSGEHVLRIVFVQDVDDPGGLDPDQNGTYGIVLLSGLTFLSGPGVETDRTASEDLFPQGAAHEYVIQVP